MKVRIAIITIKTNKIEFNINDNSQNSGVNNDNNCNSNKNEDNNHCNNKHSLTGNKDNNSCNSNYKNHNSNPRTNTEQMKVIIWLNLPVSKTMRQKLVDIFLT